MRNPARLRTAFLILVAACLTAAAVAATPRAVPDDGRIVMTDYGCRDWGPDLVHFRVDTKRFPPGQVVLHDAAGQPVPFQIEGDVLSFVASLPKGQTVAWKLVPGKPDPKATTLQVRKTADSILAGNEFFTLRLPPAGTKRFANGVAASEVPTPLAGWQPAGGPWMGASRFVTDRKVVSCALAVLRNGPACFEYEARYRFEPAGQYVCRVAVSPGLPLARISEEIDSGTLQRNNASFLMLDLSKGWRPSRFVCVEQAGEVGMKIACYPLAEHLAAKRQAAFKVSAFGGTGAPPPPVRPEKDLFLLDRIVPGGKWGGLRGGVGFFARISSTGVE